MAPRTSLVAAFLAVLCVVLARPQQGGDAAPGEVGGAPGGVGGAPGGAGGAPGGVGGMMGGHAGGPGGMMGHGSQERMMGGGPMGMAHNPMMAKMAEAMANNPFMNSLTPDQRAQFIAIKLNQSLSKGQILSSTKDFVSKLPETAQKAYDNWHNNMTQTKTEMINKIKSSLSTDGQALVDKIQSIVDDPATNYTETCHRVIDAVNGTSKEVKTELRTAAQNAFPEAAKMGMPGGMKVEGGAGSEGQANAHAGGPLGDVKMMGGMPKGDICEMMAAAAEHFGHVLEHMSNAKDNDGPESVPAVPVMPASRR